MPRHSQAALFLLGILRAETDTEHRLSAPKLLLRLAERGIKTERRSVYRAVDALRAHGAPIEKTSTGYYYAHAEEADALYALVAAVQAAGFLTDARKEALPLPGETALPLSHSLARLARENETCAQMAAAQSRASDLGALCRAKPEPMGGIYRQKIIFLTN